MTVLLNNKTCYSLMESTLTIHQLIEFAKSNNMKAIGICDTNCLFAAMNFYKEAKKNNIKPIIGCEVKVKIEESVFPYLIYCRNNEGYKELIRLSSYLCSNNSFISYQMLTDLTKNCLIVIDSNSYILSLLNEKRIDKAKEYLNSLEDNYYIALASNDTPFNHRYNEIVKELVKDSNVKVIASKKALYLNKNSYQAYCTLQALKNNTTVTDSRLVLDSQARILSYNEFDQLFDEIALINSDIFASLIDLNLEDLKTDLPKYETNSNLTNQQFLRDLCYAGLKKRLEGVNNPLYRKRLDYELDIICKMKFEEYFLIIYDLIKYARKIGIYIGPGRGSSVGSLVAYCLGITHLDPIKYGLLFERFLNPERISMPDIDIDIPDDAREKLIDYTIEKYGNDKVSHIVTFGTFGFKAALRDGAKTNNIPNSILDRTLSLLSDNAQDNLDSFYLNNKQYRLYVDSYDDAKKLFNIARTLEGLPRTISIHASGIVISQKPLNDVVPVCKVSDNLAVQYTMEHLEPIGLIKFDFLALKNLTTINTIFHDINPNRNIMDVFRMPLNDANTFKLLQSSDTNGIFQLEKSSLKSTCKRIKPTSFEDIATVLAIGRPGPSQYIDRYIENRNNPANIKYLHPDFKPILQDTYGIIIYQEQIMQIAVRIAGFSLAKADTLRKAIGKKDGNLMKSLKDEFISGGKRKGYSEAVITDTYDMILKFAEYGFNKSHAVAYALIAYQQAYFKANFPLIFYKAQLNGVIGSIEKTNEYVLECKKRGIVLLPPNINYSTNKYELVENKIRFPLNAINGISNIVAKAIINDREHNGFYKDYCECYCRIHQIDKTDKVFTNLIHGCALDVFNLTHNTMLLNIDSCKQYCNLCQINQSNQISFDFDLVAKPMLVKQVDSIKDNLNNQFDALGFYLTAHPVEIYRKQYPNASYSNILEHYRGNVSLLAMVNDMKTHRTKNGEMMCFITVSDECGKFECTLMPNLYEKYKDTVKRGIILYIEGQKSNYDSVKINRITILKG